MGRGELGVAHSGALRPQKLPVKLNNEHSLQLHEKKASQVSGLIPQEIPVKLDIFFQHHLTLRFSIIFQCPTLFVFIFVAKRWQSPEQDPTLPKRTIDINYQCQLICILSLAPLGALYVTTVMNLPGSINAN